MSKFDPDGSPPPLLRPLNSYPSQDGDPSSRPERPGKVRTARTLLIVLGVVSLIVGLYLMGNVSDREIGGKLFALYAVFALLYFVFGLLVGQGRQGAVITATVFIAIDLVLRLIQLLSGRNVTAGVVIGGALGVWLLVSMWHEDSREYYRVLGGARRRGNPRG